MSGDEFDSSTIGVDDASARDRFARAVNRWTADVGQWVAALVPDQWHCLMTMEPSARRAFVLANGPSLSGYLAAG